VSRSTQEQQQERHFVFAYGTITVSGVSSQILPLTKHFVTLLDINTEVTAL